MAYVFKVKLEETSKPIVWRRIRVNENETFHRFHFIIQGAFGWRNAHLYQFSKDGYRGRPIIKADYDEFFDEEPLGKRKDWPGKKQIYDAREILLSDYFTEVKGKITYIYDFGDDWTHKVELEKITDEEGAQPECLAGKGACPPEDCGGTWGYYDLVEVLNNPKHPEHKDARSWIGLPRGEKWDVNEFDLEEANEGIRNILKMCQ